MEKKLKLTSIIYLTLMLSYNLTAQNSNSKNVLYNNSESGKYLNLEAKYIETNNIFSHSQGQPNKEGINNSNKINGLVYLEKNKIKIVELFKDFNGGLLFLIVFLLFIYFSFLATLSSAIMSVNVRNRKLSPRQVYLLLIPYFNIIWYFILVKRVANSFKSEFKSRNIDHSPQPAYNIGLALSLLNVLAWFSFLIPIPYFSFIISLPFFICWIVYLISVINIKNEIVNLGEYDYNSIIFSSKTPSTHLIINTDLATEQEIKKRQSSAEDDEISQILNNKDSYTSEVIKNAENEAKKRNFKYVSEVELKLDLLNKKNKKLKSYLIIFFLLVGIYAIVVFILPKNYFGDNNDQSIINNIPTEIQSKMNKVNQLIQDVDKVSSSTDMFSEQELNNVKNKLDYLNEAQRYMQEIAESGYSSQISGFENTKTSIQLQLTGLKMQKEGIEQILSNKYTTNDNNSTNNSMRSNNEIKFSNDQDVYIYLNGKIFDSPDGSIRISISNFITINGTDAYFNLTIRALNESTGIIKGESLKNPNGTITIYVYPLRGCISSDGDDYFIVPVQ
ncbi:MAG: hypothetical protein ACOYO1_20335 [Bacteroidales bacterium]